MSTPVPSKLDANQVLQGSFDDVKGRLRVETEATIINGAVEVAIDASTDNIQIRDPNTNNNLKINADGSINTTGTSTVSGTINTNLNGLASFQTSQATIGTSPVQLTVSPLTNRSAICLKAITTLNNIIYIGNSSSVTEFTGYPLFNGDALQIDLKGTDQVWAIATDIDQTIAVIEAG